MSTFTQSSLQVALEVRKWVRYERILVSWWWWWWTLTTLVQGPLSRSSLTFLMFVHWEIIKVQMLTWLGRTVAYQNVDGIWAAFFVPSQKVGDTSVDRPLIITRSSAITERRDALYQLKYWPTVVRITQADRVSVWGALSATVTFYSATCIVLYTHHSIIAQRACDAVGVINRRPCNQPCWCQLDHKSKQSKQCVAVSNHLPSPLLTRHLWSSDSTITNIVLSHRVFLRQRTIVDADNRGGWTQFFGGKASE